MNYPVVDGKPTKSGVYWYQEPDSFWRTVIVCALGPACLRAYNPFHRDSGCRVDAWPPGEWRGPIPEPKKE